MKKNSLHAKIYKYFYNKRDEEMPTNICSYIWSSLISWIFLVPYFIWNLPTYISIKLKIVNTRWYAGKIWHLSTMFNFFYFILYCICFYINSVFIKNLGQDFYDTHDYFWQGVIFSAGGMFFFIFVTIILVIILIWNVHFLHKFIFYIKSNYLIGIFKYVKKFCKPITWE
jgi:flagellar biosynthesis protein FlhB